TAGYSWATAVYQGIAENLVFQADQAKQSSMRETATAATKVNAHTAAHREQFPSLASAPTARQPAAHRDLGAAHPPAGRTPPASGAKRVHPGPSHQLGSSQVRKIDGREQASAPRGPSAEQRARNEAALGSATAFLHSPGITLKDAPIVANHCKDVVKHFFPNTVIGDPSPIHSVDTERENYLGISFRTNDLLLMMIAHPPTINGVVTLWQGEQGVMHPIVLAGVPLHFLDFQVRAALREAGNGAAPATQLLVDGFLTGDWSGMIFLPEGVPLPKNIQLGRHTRRTTILPAHIAVPCVTCRTRNPDHCRCAAPNCHFVHRESRLAAQQAAAAAYATAAAALTQSPAEPESDLAINSATVVDTLEIAPISGSDASPPTPAPLVDSPATVNPPTPIATPPHSTPSVSGAETPVPCTQGDATLADPSLPGLVTGQSAPAPAAAAVLPPTTTTNACLANDSPPVSGAVAHLQRATPLNQSEAVAAMPQQSPSTHCGTVAAQARGSRSPTPATPDTGNPTPLESDKDAGMNEPDSDAAMSDEESDSEMTEITGQNELGQRTVTHLPKKSATTRSTTKAKAVTPTQAPTSASTGAKRSRVSKKAATTTTTPALLKDPSIALLASNRTPRSRARASAPEAGVDAAGSGSTQTVTDLAAAGTATG
ncbi:hypothetical protein LPJ71_006828, partial [Coemansia sp. S17]